jgi:hypothetical protein
MINFNGDSDYLPQSPRYAPPEDEKDKALLPIEILDDVSAIVFETPFPFPFGGFGLNLTMNNEPIIFQTPWLKIPFGLNEHKIKNDMKYSISVALPTEDVCDPDVAIFINFIKMLDELVITKGLEEKATWFPEFTDEEIRSFYQASYREPRDPTKGYPPTFKMKLPNRRNACQFQTRFFIKGQSVHLDVSNIHDFIARGAKVRAVTAVLPLWVVGNCWGLSFKPLQMEIRPDKTRTIPTQSLFR